MTQERMHPDDLRAILAATYHATAPEGIPANIGIDRADSLLAELARAAKPEAREPRPGEIDAHLLGEALDAMAACQIVVVNG